MKIEYLIKRRKISERIITPLLVPSFSSTIFGLQDKRARKEVSDIYQYLQNKIKNTLFSLYDIHKKYLTDEVINSPNVLFLDSGSYEYLKYKRAGFKVKWSKELYNNALDKINRKKNIVQVNYDIFDTINKQIDVASDGFKKNYFKDFIIKPNKNQYFIDSFDVMSNVDKLSGFNLIGLTEKELGDSLLKKCQNIIKIRSGLSEEGLEIPIHIFGVIDPLSIILYSLCGADVFDGLSWIKNGFINNLAIYDDNYALLNGFFEFNENNSLQIMLINNLSTLSEVQSNIIKFTRTLDWSVLNINSGLEEKMKLLLSNSGIDISVKE